MLREKQRFISSMHKLLDIFITCISFILAVITKKVAYSDHYAGFSSETYSFLILLIIIIWYIVFTWAPNYIYSDELGWLDILTNTLKIVVISATILSTIFYLLKIEGISRFIIVTFLFYDVLLLCISKLFIVKISKKRGFVTDNKKHIIIVGTKERAVDLIKGIEEKTPNDYEILGCLDTGTNNIGKSIVNGYKIIGCIHDLEKHLIENIVDEIVFAIPLRIIENADLYIATAEDMGVHVRIIPDWQLHYLMYEPDIATIKFKNLAGTPTMSLHMTTPNEGALFLKSLFDFVASIIILLICSPFFLITSIAIKLSSPGPVFFKQERLGLHGRKFHVYKFRTMVENAEELKDSLKDKNESDGPVFKIKQDPRIIPYIGAFLRKTNLDELPQLINVLKREMSLVGPRPPITSEVNSYEIWHRRRLSMKPGITCLWQIAKNRNDISFDNWIKLDLKYIDSWSIILDFKILVMTFNTVFLRSGR
ncbi:sugar transferase [Desulforegula conservatrix]|uniref:sugar transferase n=1 Tax=Desulforegula conservatrix TaxID=153026 RepID=UPI000403732B|nr:sugar transferase [Desulforegula conservatrix]